jgi:hypothetical protein
MESMTLNEDILVYCITATSFPDGVKQAHESLHTLVPFEEQRKYFGLSWPQDGQIIYKAAAEELHPGELSRHKLETITLVKGTYLYIDIHDFMKDIPAIGEAFQQLIHDDRIAADGFCIEWYMPDDLCRCMVKAR